MFNINDRTPPVITGNVDRTIEGNRLIPGGTPISPAQVITTLQRDIYKDKEPTGETFTGGVSIRLGIFNPEGAYVGVVKQLSASFLNTDGSTAVDFSDEVSKAVIAGQDVTSTDFGFRFQIGIFDPKTGNVVIKYDDREYKLEDETGDTETEANPIAAFMPQKTTKVERKGIGFINIFSWDKSRERYFRIGSTQLQTKDQPNLVALLNAEQAGYSFAPVLTPTKELAEWLSVKDQVKPNSITDLLDPA